MSYFASFNYVRYPNFENQENFLILKDISSRVVRKEDILDDKSVYYEYVIRNEDNIEDVSYKLYGTPFYYWTIMIVNNRFDRFYDFPMNNKQFENYLIEKYGSVEFALTNYKYYIRTDELQNSEDSKIDDTYFYEVFVDPNNYDKTFDWPNFAEYSNGVLMKKTKTLYDYELDLNESKRTILVIDKRYISEFVNTFNRLIR